MAGEAEDLAARLRAEFPHALRSGQLVACYQPEVELATGRLVAAESLVRWEHPELGTLPPALFTPVAFIVSVGIAEIGTCPDLPTLLAHADAAMYEAKRAGGCWRLYEDTEQAAALSL